MRFQLCGILALPLLALGEQIVVKNPITQQTMPTLADLLTIEQTTSIFYSYARELTSSNVFSDSGASPITLLVPTNKAVMALSRKPHQGPAPDIVITDEEFDSKSKENVERWVSAHIIPQSPIAFDQTYPTLLDGKTITFTQSKKGDTDDWSRAVIEGKVHIIGKREASNGVLFLIDGTIPSD
ncbi:hypothetical protein DFH07DRAFT_857059 [Mycena maculata]|uniref:FAS1 domain-containing protein n=1 Tax=Mycena maculata TaxID=230809 RepID=A0AAD7MLL1_9AGAR|nr:hypothetical protein DFH07DRAFT_857059 [Mycena maculata]